MPNLNKAMVIGHLGKDPDVRYMPNGDAVANFALACTRKWKGKDGEKKEDTQWINVVFFGKVAEVISTYCHKGDPLYIEGWIRTRKWQDKDGNDRYTTEVVGEQMQLLGSKRDKPEPKKEEEAPEYNDDDVPFD